MTSFGQAIAVAALTVASVLGIAAARQVSIGRDAVAAADAAAAKSDWPEAIARARAAAEALVPGSPWPERGLRRLATIGHDAEARGDDPTALLAYGAMRTAALETSPIGSKDTLWRSAAEEGLARVTASTKDASVPRVSTQSMLAALRDDANPGAGWLALLAASAVAMIGGLGRLLIAGHEGRGARLAQGALAAGFVAYAIVMVMNAR
ncbi:MAG: hypothetical protein ACLP1X_30080 [Polyangiaceae bacterium]